jgi:hypothetical protein
MVVALALGPVPSYGITNPVTGSAVSLVLSLGPKTTATEAAVPRSELLFYLA